MTGDAPQISVTEAKEILEATRLGQGTLLDVQQDFEYAEGHLPGATHIPLPELSERVGELDPALPTVVYCRSGMRSLAAANLLHGLGYRDVASMRGGIMAWEGAQAQGPFDLGLAKLLAPKNAHELLERAWAMELALGEFYATLAGKSVDADVSALFGRLAGFEEKHRRTLTEIWKRLGGNDSSGFESRAKAFASADSLEGGIGPSDYLGMIGDPVSVPEALELAMAVEAQAMDLYLRRAKTETDADLRRTLVLLAEEEKAHLKVLGTFVDSRNRF